MSPVGFGIGTAWTLSLVHWEIHLGTWCVMGACLYSRHQRASTCSWGPNADIRVSQKMLMSGYFPHAYGPLLIHTISPVKIQRQISYRRPDFFLNLWLEKVLPWFAIGKSVVSHVTRQSFPLSLSNCLSQMIYEAQKTAARGVRDWLWQASGLDSLTTLLTTNGSKLAKAWRKHQHQVRYVSLSAPPARAHKACCFVYNLRNMRVHKR
jgi:hypothetical protein